MVRPLATVAGMPAPEPNAAFRRNPKQSSPKSQAKPALRNPLERRSRGALSAWLTSSASRRRAQAQSGKSLESGRARSMQSHPSMRGRAAAFVQPKFSFYAHAIRPGLTVPPRRPWLVSHGGRSRPSTLAVRHIVYGTFTVLMLLVGTVVLFMGSQVHGLETSSERGPPLLVPEAADLTSPHAGSTSTAVPLGPLVTSPATTPATPPPPPAQPAAAPRRTASLSTIASWYGQRPLACYDAGRRLPLPEGLGLWAASRTLACGTTIRIVGPAGTIDVLIEDHGPYLHPGRDLDLSPIAFGRVAGPLARGLVRVTYSVEQKP